AGLAPFAGAVTDPHGADAAALAERARDTFDADVGLGVAPARVVEDAGHDATEIVFAVSTPDGARTREMRFFGTGERA
ncbi:MAG: hypothetical protein GWN07_07770, partial [Actinobacteria bacterium]|nr:hypothetical protein [Actinomycetota bacterium]NIS30119.1 hypothetical protein [Actinomycetota bacterium]NIU65378.1 hypothetical protein [Actinomycetota bacterium]NIV86371.1 hypothetical protein [Actinomycetota bacterium]NIW27176.1 hypothetical protein [Actinomycetota bacterium]